MKYMTSALLLLLAFVADSVTAGGDNIPCSADWYRFVERQIISGDGQGHGPDIGSDEWKGVIEFKLGIRGQPGIPPRDSDEWCRYIDRLVHELHKP